MADSRPVLFKTLDKDAETGLIIDESTGKRILTFRTETFLKLMDRFVEMLGEGLSATLLHQMGIDLGRTAFSYVKDEVKSDSDLTDAMDTLQAEGGWGRCKEIRKIETSGITYVVRTESNPISGRHATNEPICHLMRGMYTGFLEAYLNRKAKQSEQISCRVLGAPYCTFEIIFE